MRRLGLLAAALLIGLGIAEALLIVIDPSAPGPPLYPGDIDPPPDSTLDPVLGWKMPPNTTLTETTLDYSVQYRTNSSGFRSTRELTISREHRRIVLIGDSYTFGSGVENHETFASRLEAELDGVQTYNLGVGAYGLDQMWLSLRHYGASLQPDLVVLAFINLDLDRSLTSYRRDHVWRRKPSFQFRDGRLRPTSRADRPSSMVRWIARTRLAGLWRKTEVSLNKNYPVGSRWRLNKAIFAAIQAECDALGAELLVVHIPINRRSPAPIYERELPAIGIELLDLATEFPADADALFFPNDHHLNASGHQFVGAAIAEKIRSVQ